jgi:predicted nucleic acid-binding protein
MRTGEPVFVDSGAWIALALTRDPLHPRARRTWETLLSAGARIHTSVPIVIETFTFLERNAAREVALGWKDSLEAVVRLKILACSESDLELAWKYFQRDDLYRLSAVDAISFVLMAQHRIRIAFAFDGHFATAGFRLLG